MEREDDILQRAIDQYRSEPLPAQPPQEVLDATLAKLHEAAGHNSAPPKQQGVHTIALTARFAAAAAILIVAGYAVGRLSAPKPPDLQQLQQTLAASLEPAVREKITTELNQHWQSTLEAAYVALREDLTQQYRNDLVQVAAQTLAASNATTQNLLRDLLESINAAEVQQRQWFAAMAAEIEKHRRNNTEIATAMLNLAVATEDELERTKNMVSTLAETRSAETTD